MSRPLLSVWSFVSRCFRRNSSSENSEEREDKVRYQFPASPPARLLDSRYFFILLISLVVAVAAAIVGQVLVKLLYLVSNIAFYGSFSAMFRDPSLHNLGVGVIFLPCVGGFLTSLLVKIAKAPTIRGQGIPESIVRIMFFKSEISPRILFAKPVASALAVGTGAPFGTEGSVIATGSALGSFLAQFLTVTAEERKLLLVTGAAAGMSSVFDAPLAATLLSVELLLLEIRPRSLIAVALGSYVASLIRYVLQSIFEFKRTSSNIFDIGTIVKDEETTLPLYMLIAILVTLASVFAARCVALFDKLFRKLEPLIPDFWWPVIGGVFIGLIGYFSPRTLGVGGQNISDFAKGVVPPGQALGIAGLKLLSWSIALGCGCSGGVVAPLLSMGTGLGVFFGSTLQNWLPQMSLQVNMCAAIGMSAMLTGATRAPFTAIALFLETTHQASASVPVVGACFIAYFISLFCMRFSLLEDAIDRTTGYEVPQGFGYDPTETVTVAEIMCKEVESIHVNASLGAVVEWLHSGETGSQHKSYPVLNDESELVSVVHRCDILQWFREESDHQQITTNSRHVHQEEVTAASSNNSTVRTTARLTRSLSSDPAIQMTVGCRQNSRHEHTHDKSSNSSYRYAELTSSRRTDSKVNLLRIADFLPRMCKPVVVSASSTVTLARQHMIENNVVLIPVLQSELSDVCVGVVTAVDLLTTHRKAKEDATVPQRLRQMRLAFRGRELFRQCSQGRSESRTGSRTVQVRHPLSTIDSDSTGKNVSSPVSSCNSMEP